MEHLSTSVQVCTQVISMRQGVLAMTTATKRKTSHSTKMANNSETALVVRRLFKYRELTIYFCFLNLSQ